MNNLKRTVFLAVKLLFLAGMCALAVYLLWRYEYLSQFLQIDNVIGLLPVVLLLIGLTAFGILLFVPGKRKNRILCICLAAIVVLSFALFPNSLRANWWIDYGQQPMTTEHEPDLSVYAPFSEGNRLASLDTPSSHTLTHDLPQLDGAVALYPVYAAFAQAFYDEEAYFAEGGTAGKDYQNEGERVIMTNTLRAYDGIIAGERDVIFVAGASAAQRAKAEAQGVDLVFTPIGKEAFVFLTAASNPVENLTYQQIKNIYSGKTARWSTLGWREGGQIIAFQRPEGSGSQTGLQNLMGDLPLIVPQPLPSRELVGTNSLMQQMSVTWKGVQPALGYSYKFYATVMYSNPDTKLLSVNGYAPTPENISSGAYPFTANFYAVTRGEPTGNVKTLIEWILSEEGQELIEKTGYARL